jgi:hypothetical protein
MMGMSGGAPWGTWRTGILLMASQTDLGTFGAFHFLETQNCAGLLSSCFEVPACRAMARLATVIAMHVEFERLRMRFVANFAERILVDVLGAGD